MRTRVLFFGVSAMVALTACTGVFSRDPVGSEPLVLAPEEWEGTWSDADSSLEIRVVDAEAGRLEAAWIETRDDGFELERVEVLLRQVDEAVIGSALEENEAEAEVESDPAMVRPRYAIFRAARDGGKIIVWWPSVEGFKAAVEDGRLPGEVTEGGDVVLGDLGPDQLELLSGEASAELWQWREPAVLFRTGSP